MQNFYAFYDPVTGKIVSRKTIAPIAGPIALTIQELADAEAAEQGLLAVQSDVVWPLQSTYIDLETKEHLAMGERPSRFHEWDWGSHSWLHQLQAQKDGVVAEIERERHRREIAPIEYLGATLDADEKAQKNISGKLQEIREFLDLGQEMAPEMLFWKDFSNFVHVFSTMAEYKTWLGGLAIAITQRGTMAYAWAWQMKEAVNAANSIEELENISW